MLTAMFRGDSRGERRRLRRTRIAPVEQPALDQDLGDLNGVGRGTLAQVVAHDPHAERPRMRLVAADAADEHLVPAGRPQGGRYVLDEPVGRVAEPLDDLPGG